MRPSRWPATALFIALFRALTVDGLTINTPGTLIQCVPVMLMWTDGTAPYYVSVIPDGQPGSTLETLATGIYATDMTWVVNLAPGQQVAFLVVDSTGSAGQSAFITIISGSSTSCMAVSAQPLTAGGASITGTESYTASSSSSAQPWSEGAYSTGDRSIASASAGASSTLRPSGSARDVPTAVSKPASHANAAAIGGGVAGGVVALLLAIFLAWFCLRRRRRLPESNEATFDLDESQLVDPFRSRPSMAPISLVASPATMPSTERNPNEIYPKDMDTKDNDANDEDWPWRVTSSSSTQPILAGPSRSSQVAGTPSGASRSAAEDPTSEKAAFTPAISAAEDPTPEKTAFTPAASPRTPESPQVFVREQDGGPAPTVVSLPPLYNPSWDRSRTYVD